MNIILLRDIAKVVTSDLYEKLVVEAIADKSLRRIEYPIKANAKKRTISNVTKTMTVMPNSIVILPEKDSNVFFIPFLIDSFYVRNVLLQGKVNVRSLLSLGIVDVPDVDKEYYCKLEKMLLVISLLGETRVGYEYFYTAERLLSDLREAIVAELYMPALLDAENIRVVKNWKHEIDRMQESRVRPFDELVTLVNSMLSPGNELYDNLKRFYLLFKEQK